MTELEKTDILRLSNEESNKITRECMHRALIRLMDKEPFEKITITDIVKVAGVSRNAFYRNYDSKEELFEEVMSVVRDHICEGIDSWNRAGTREERMDIIVKTLSEIRDNARDFRILLSIRNNVIDPVEMEKHVPSGPPEKQYTYISHFASITGVITRWLMNGMKEPVDRMTEICLDIFPQYND